MYFLGVIHITTENLEAAEIMVLQAFVGRVFNHGPIAPVSRPTQTGTLVLIIPRCVNVSFQSCAYYWHN